MVLTAEYNNHKTRNALRPVFDRSALRIYHVSTAVSVNRTRRGEASEIEIHGLGVEKHAGAHLLSHTLAH